MPEIIKLKNLIKVAMFLCAFSDALGSWISPALAADPPLKNVLLILPHPDDEAYIRSFIARWIENGVQISAMYLTAGEGGWDFRWPESTPRDQSHKNKLAEVRAAEVEEAAKKYKFHETFQFRFPDDPMRDAKGIRTLDPTLFTRKEGPWDVEAITKEMIKIKEKLHPDMVVSFYPKQTATHVHHQATALLVGSVFKENFYGFYQAESIGKMKLNENRVTLSPLTKSTVPGENFGIAYGEIGTRGSMEHKSQLFDNGKDFIQNWKNNPPEVIAPVTDKLSLNPLLESLGNIQGLQVHAQTSLSCSNFLTPKR